MATKMRKNLGQQTIHWHSLFLGVLAILSLLAVGIPSCYAEDVSVMVDFQTQLGTPTHRATGWIYGLSEDGTQPAQSFQGDIKAQFFRAGGAQLGCPDSGWSNGGYSGYIRRWNSVKAYYQRAKAVGATFVLLPHDLWGADLVCNVPVWPGDNGDWTNFNNFIDQLIKDVVASGMTGRDVHWDIWNEPDCCGFWDGHRSQEQYLEMWKRAYKKIRAALPNAVIVGPSSSGQPSPGWGWFNTYLDYVKANNVMPDYISWHELNTGSDPVNSKNNVASMLSARGMSVRGYQVNEYGSPSEQTTGDSAWYIARLERAGIDGARANWGMYGGLYDTMGELVVNAGGYKPLGAWWVYKRYGEMTGKHIGVTGASSVDGVAAADPATKKAIILLGSRNNRGQVTVNVGNIPSYLVSNGQTHVLLERMPETNGAPVSAPIVIRNEDLTLNNTQLSIPISWSNESDAYVVTLTSGNSFTPTPAPTPKPTPAPTPTPAPGQEVGVRLNAAGGNGRVDLNWTTSGAISAIQVYRDTDANPSGRQRIGILPGNARSYTDNAVANGTTYWYWIKYTDTSRNTGNSNAGSATPMATGPAPTPTPRPTPAPTPKPTPLPDKGATCANAVALTLPKVFTGAADTCLVTSGIIDSVNSWDAEVVEINGVSYKSQWSNQMPARINGNYYIRYVAKLSWAHFEINGSGGIQPVAVTGVEVTPTNTAVKSGSTTILTATVAPNNATNKNVNWQSSNTGIATVSQTGVVTGVSAGTATITATTADGGRTATSTVKVSADPVVTNYTLTIAVSGNGSTSVAAGPHSYASGTTVSVTATPAIGSVFSGWSGAVIGNANPVTVTMDANKSLTANFMAKNDGNTGDVINGSTETAWAANCPTAPVSACVPGTWQDPGSTTGDPAQCQTAHFVVHSPNGTITASQCQAALDHLENTVWPGYFGKPVFFPEPYCNSATKWKASVHIHSDYDLTGGSWGNNYMGMWVGPGATADHWGLAHEFMHGVQSVAGQLGGCNPNTCGWLFESHANFMPHQLPEFQNNVHCSEMLANAPHLYLGSTRDRYCNWQWMEYLKDKHCYQAVNDIWTQAQNTQDPFMVLKANMGWSQAQLNDFFGEWAMHNIIWDYKNPPPTSGNNAGAMFRSNYGAISDTSRAERRLRLTKLDPVDLKNRRFATPADWAPQRWGYNVVRLYPEQGASSVTVMFRGVTGGNNGWRWGLVATDGALTTARYSPVQPGSDGALTFRVNSGESLWLVVTGAPTVHETIVWDQMYNTVHRYPWMVQIDGAWPEGWQGGTQANCASGLTRHSNGGGCVKSGVPASVYVGPYAQVLGGSVSGNATIDDHATILNGTVSGGTVAGLTILDRGFRVNGGTVATTFYPMGFFESNQSVSGSAQVLGDVEYRGDGLDKSSGTYFGFVDSGTRPANDIRDVSPAPPYVWR